MGIEKIISGGQTGADMGGLLAGASLGIKTGGMVPEEYRTAFGNMAELLKRFGVVESDYPEYAYRTANNIINSDVTCIFAYDPGSPETKLTMRICREWNKPYCVITKNGCDFDRLIKFLIEHNPSIVNIAGDRESVAPGIENFTYHILRMALMELKGRDDRH